MLITDKEKLKAFDIPHRIWQGIPSIERTSKGKTYVCYYSGGVTEEIGNFTCLYRSDDEIAFDMIAVCRVENGRCYDGGLWIDPLKRLWFYWSVSTPQCSIWAVICENPDAEELVFGEPFCFSDEVVQVKNKPTVLSTGEWLFPGEVWRRDYLRFYHSIMRFPEGKDGAYLLKTSDNGKTFTTLGPVVAEDRSFEEHMVLEKKDGTLAMYIRTNYGIAVCHSYDRGKHWTTPVNSGIKGPCSRFHIRRLRSGHVLMINHYDFTARDHLCAMISEDDGETFPYRLLLDERAEVSYPDCTENEDGSISIVYDRERGAALHSFEEVYRKAREILICRITEEDIRAGTLVSEKSYLRRVISKLGRYEDEEHVDFGEYYECYPNEDIADIFIESMAKNEIIPHLFDMYRIPCTEINGVDIVALDDYVRCFMEGEDCDRSLLIRILEVLRRGKKEEKSESGHPVVAFIRTYLQEHYADAFHAEELAARFRISRYYMFHLFKSETGITLGTFLEECRLTAAKEMLLSGKSAISEIAVSCGYYDANYFSHVFKKSEGITPTAYRRLHQA